MKHVATTTPKGHRAAEWRDRIRHLRDRGLGPELSLKLWWLGDPELVDLLELATDAQLAELWAYQQRHQAAPTNPGEGSLSSAAELTAPRGSTTTATETQKVIS